MTETPEKDNQTKDPIPASFQEEKPDSAPETPTSFDYINKVSKKTGPFNKKTLFLIIAGLALLGIIIGAVSASKKSPSKTVSPSPTFAPESIITSSPEPSPEATDSAEINLTDYSIKILNGSGEKGEASAVRSLLITEGFEDIDTANADNYDYTDTEVSLKADVSETIYDTIEAVLSETYTLLLDSDPLTDDSDYDVVIIVGQKQEAE